jgi:hypothetical protein
MRESEPESSFMGLRPFSSRRLECNARDNLKARINPSTPKSHACRAHDRFRHNPPGSFQHFRNLLATSSILHARRQYFPRLRATLFALADKPVSLRRLKWEVHRTGRVLRNSRVLYFAFTNSSHGVPILHSFNSTRVCEQRTRSRIHE